MKANKKSLYQEGGSVAKDSINPVVNELSDVIKNNIENGGSPEEILKTFLLQGIPVDQLTLAFESAGFDPSSFGELLQNVEIMMAQEEQAQQQPQQPQQAAPVEPSMMQPQNEEQPPMQFGGNVSSGYLSPTTQDERPIYMPPVPAKGNILGAAFLLDDAASRLFSGKDENNDGVMDGTFRDWKAKNARYKDKQLGNRTYEVNYGDLDPKDYVANWKDLASGTVRTKEEIREDLLENSLVDFDPEKNDYTGIMATRPEDFDVLGKKTKMDLGLLGQKKEGLAGFFGGREEVALDQNSNSLQNVIKRLNALDDVDSDIMANAAKNYESGQGLNSNRSSYDKSLLSSEDYVKAQADYRNLMLGNVPMGSTDPADFITNTPSKVTKTEPGQQERSIVELPREEVGPPMAADSYKDWAKKNQVKLQLKGLTTEAQQRAAYEAASEFKYGGALPKAQYGIPGSGMGGVYADQLDFENLMNNMQTDYAADTQAVADSQLQTENPGLGATPLQNQQAVIGSGPGSGMGSMFLDQQALQKELEGINQTDQIDQTADTTVTNDSFEPTVKRKRSVGNGLKQAETFIKDNPVMKAFGDVSDFVVKGANLANELFTQSEFYDYKNKLRNSTVADNVYLATQNPVNKRGTFDVNLGLAEPDNLVDYYAQAMYGKELYKSGGEFEPHMMFDPVSGKGYKANVEADHNRFAKLGFLHQDEMQGGGEVEIDNDTLAALIAAGADIEIL